MSSKKEIKIDALDSPWFMEDMQRFRDAPKCTNMENRKETVRCLDMVKDYIRENVKNIRGKNEKVERRSISGG